MNFRLFHLLFALFTTTASNLKSKFSRIYKKDQMKGMGADLIKYIRNADSQMPALHDIKIQIGSDLHRYLIEGGQIRNEKNKGIKLSIPTPDPSITVKALVYPQTVQLDIGCTMKSFADDDNGKREFAKLLNSIWQTLCEYSGHKAEMDQLSEWTLTHYHYNKDGNMEYDGKKFHITARDAFGDFIRAYDKCLLDGRQIVRIEKIQTRRISVREFLDNGRDKT